MAGIYQMMHRETVTLANMKISSVAAGAFIDFGDSETNKLISHLGYLIKIRSNSNNACLQGFGKAAGTAETYLDIIGGTDPALLNGNMASAEPPGTAWTRQSDWTIAAGIASCALVAGASNQIYQDLGFSTNVLLKVTHDITVASGTLNRYLGTSSATIVFTSSVIGSVEYKTKADYSYITFRGLTGFAGSIDNVTVQRVTAPSASGITIVDGKGSATQSFAQKGTAFNYADASGYTVEYWKVNSAVQVDSDAVANADATLVLTDGSAAWSAVGIDDSAYMDGKYAVAIYDSTNVMVAWGFYKSAGAGAVVSTHGGAMQNWAHIGTGSVLGNFIRKVFYVGAP